MSQLDKFYDDHDVSTDAQVRFLVPRDEDLIHPISAEHKRLDYLPKGGRELMRQPEE